nr:L,D-transpeptidase [uncultured Flavobacterium sp.]
MKIIPKMSLLFMLIIIYSCKKENEINLNSQPPIIENEKPFQKNLDSINKVKADSLAQIKKDSVNQLKEKLRKKKKFRITEGMAYIAWPMKVSDSLRKVFYKTYSRKDIYDIAALNRVDTDNLSKRDTIIVPKELKENFIDYSPFPFYTDVLIDVPKFIIFSYPIQAYAVYENGTLIKWGPTNMGKKATQTPRGLFFTNWRGRKVKSTSNDEWILNWNFNISNFGGVGFHQYALPGYPASHSCLRLLDADAQFLYNWCDQWILKDSNTQIAKGTPVIVYGDYAFGKKGIWNELVKDPNITTITLEQLNNEIESHVPEILKQQQIRLDYLKAKNETSEITVKTDSLSIN